MAIIYRPMTSEDWTPVAELIYESLNTWYRKNRGFDLVSGPRSKMLVFPRVYESLDPGCCVVAINDKTDHVVGSCFYHPRPTHVSLGILNVHPVYFRQKVASGLLRYVIDFAEQKKLPLRLVSSAMNLESFSLYNRYGFIPTIAFQDMTAKVPDTGFDVAAPAGTTLRPAVMDDVPAMTALEMELYSIDREKDFRFFIKNEEGIWHTSVLIRQSTGAMEGFVSSVFDPGSNMIGPGIARTQEGMAALIRAELNQHCGRSPVWLIPADCVELRKAMYELKAQNCEIHFGQVRGSFTPATGVVLPSFMPETS